MKNLESPNVFGSTSRCGRSVYNASDDKGDRDMSSLKKRIDKIRRIVKNENSLEK